MLNSISGLTFDNPAIFTEILLQGLLGGLGVEPSDEELPWSVRLCHAQQHNACKHTRVVLNTGTCIICKHRSATCVSPRRPDISVSLTSRLGKVFGC